MIQMNRKYLVEIYIPAAQKTFDMRIPAGSRIGEINILVAGIAAELSGGFFSSSGNSFLADAVSGEILDVNLTAEEHSIQNGTRLLLV